MNSNLQKRRILFLFGCVVVRLMLSKISKEVEQGYAKYLSILLIGIGIGFWYIYTFNLRKTGAEVFGDRIWWNQLRPVHGTLYILAGLSLLNVKYQNYAWKLLLVDVLIGLVKFVIEHSSKA